MTLRLSLYLLPPVINFLFLETLFLYFLLQDSIPELRFLLEKAKKL